MGSIGVTGHRTLARPELVTAASGDALDRITTAGGWAEASVCSSLAEGADRVLARAALDRPGWALEVVLPLEPDDYETDFAAEASRHEFRELLAAARSVEVVDPRPNREQAYAAAGTRMLDRSDALVAVWDGEPARGVGGTAEVVAEARRRLLPLVWVRPGDDVVSVTDERLESLRGGAR